MRLDPRAFEAVRPMGSAEDPARETGEEHAEKRMSMGYFGTFWAVVQVSTVYPMELCFSSPHVWRGLKRWARRVVRFDVLVAASS